MCEDTLMPGHVFEGAVCMQVVLCQSIHVCVCVGDQECNGAGTVVSSRGCGARSEAHTQVILELIRLCGVILGNCVQRLWYHPAYESHH